MKVKLGQERARKVLSGFNSLHYDQIKELWDSPLGCEFTIKKIKPARTRSQEKYYRKWCGEFAKENGTSPDSMHEIILKECFSSKFINVNGKSYSVPSKRSADTTIETYGELIETLIRCASFAGFVVPPPEIN